MKKKILSVAETKATSAKHIREVEQGKPILVPRHGKPVAALVRPEDLETLERLRAAGPEGGLASIAGGWEDSQELTENLEGITRTRPRGAPGLD